MNKLIPTPPNQGRHIGHSEIQSNQDRHIERSEISPEIERCSYTALYKRML